MNDKPTVGPIGGPPSGVSEGLVNALRLGQEMQKAKPKSCEECEYLNMTWGCKNGDMPCPWFTEKENDDV